MSRSVIAGILLAFECYSSFVFICRKYKDQRGKNNGEEKVARKLVIRVLSVFNVLSLLHTEVFAYL